MARSGGSIECQTMPRRHPKPFTGSRHPRHSGLVAVGDKGAMNSLARLLGRQAAIDEREDQARQVLAGATQNKSR